MCEVYVDDDNRADVWNETHRTARKAHACRCCGGSIVAGERYLVVSWVSEGTAASEKMCLPCEADMFTFGVEHGGCRWAPSAFEVALADCINEDDAEEAARWEAMLAAIQARGGRETGGAS